MDSPAFWPAPHATPSRSSSSTTLVDDRDHPASLAPHHLSRLVKSKLSPAVLDYLVDRVCEAVDFGLGHPSSSSASASASMRSSRRNHTRRWQSDKDTAVFAEFVATVLRRAEVSFSVVIGALVYIDRARPHLSIAIEEWAQHRVLLGALILASKYLNDASLKNAHWALCTGVFGRRDVFRIEREFLEVLDFELSVKESDLLRECARMVHEGVLERPAELQEKREKEKEPTTTTTSLQAVRAIWDEKARLESRPVHSRPEKRQSDVDMMDVDAAEERRERRRKERRRMEIYFPTAPASRDSISPASSCSSCSASSPDSASTSPETESDASPRTPPPPPPCLHYPPPHCATASTPAHHHQHHHHSSASASFKPLALLEHFPAVPTPPLVLTPSRKAVSAVLAVPPALPGLPPYPALPFDLPLSRPPSAALSGPSRGASPYAHLSLPVPGTRSTSPYTHRRSSAMSMALYPSYLPANVVPATNAV
ncbi:hypothetical protein DFH11DRAFT_1542253 [Phellopilus nigrolimitatus]|nr:hypothetical protein DFH11DRAFT_1542253 [Phellopilus nigrolimitatus]